MVCYCFLLSARSDYEDGIPLLEVMRTPRVSQVGLGPPQLSGQVIRGQLCLHCRGFAEVNWWGLSLAFRDVRTVSSYAPGSV